MEKGLNKLIIVIIILIIIIIVTILAILKMKDDTKVFQSNEQEVEGDPGEEVDFSQSLLHNVTEKIEYYTVKNCINEYLNAINSQSSTYYIGDELDSQIQKEYVYSLLSKEYIKKKNINNDNILSNIDTVKENHIFIPLDMKVLEKQNIKKYIAYGIVQNLNNEFVKKLYIIVNLDFENKTYSIEPLDSQYNSIDEINIVNDNISIEQNDYNTYRNQEITNQYVMNEYLLLYKRLVISNPEIIYNLMSNEYKKKRFDNLEGFKKYVKDNQKDTLEIKLSKYLVNNYDDYIEYVAKDQNDNYYIFNEYYQDNSLDLKLDTYTLITDNFKKEYENADEQKRVQLCIDKFIKMINARDYINAYECLSDSFKNNYFKTQEEFEEYVESFFFRYNKLRYNSISEKGNNTYECNLKVMDLTEETDETNDFDVVIQLKDDMSFVMLFNM